MPMFKLPLSGDVTQSINPWTSVFNPTGGQYELINITLGQSSAPEVEADVLTDVAGYGKQLGRIGDALLVLVDHLPKSVQLSKDEAAAIDALKELLQNVEKIKKRHQKRSART